MENTGITENSLNVHDEIHETEEFMNPPTANAETGEKPEENPQMADNQEKTEQEVRSFTFEDVKAKLEKEKAEGHFSKAKGLDEKILDYFEKRCSDDEGLIQDIMQEHKTWEKCYSYCENKAREMAEKGARGVVVEGDDLLEWIEDYYRKDDAAEEARKKAEEEERRKLNEEKAKKQKEEQKKKRAEAKAKKAGSKKKAADTAEPDGQDSNSSSEQKEKPKDKKSKDMDGQMSMFDLM